MLPDAWPHDALPRGTILNGYSIQAVLGRGGFGITYQAVDELDQLFAVKECFPRQFVYRADREVLPNSDSEEKGFQDCRDRFLREARALAQLGSAHGDNGVVRVVTYFRAHQTAYIVMELLDGDTLEDLIKTNKGNFPKHALEYIFDELLKSLEKVHEFGLIHRDIKPNNIIMRENNRPILIDFGAARASSVGQATNFTQIFSESYAPIEQILATTQGPMSDIYAIGATFYRAIGGKTVDALSRQQALLLNKPDPQPPAVEIGAGRYEPRFLMAVDAALRVQPDQRPQSATDLMRLLSDGQDDRAAMRVAPIASIVSRPDADITITRTSSKPRSTFQVEENNKKEAIQLTPNIKKMPAVSRWMLLVIGLVLVGSGLGGWSILWYLSKSQPSPSSSAATSSVPTSEPPPAPSPPPPAPVLEPKPTPAPLPPPAPAVQEPSAADALAKGNAALRSKDYAEAMTWFRRAAEQGNADAEIDIAFLYQNAQGVPRDYAEAMTWFRKAAEQGNGRAENAIGFLYDKGWGVPQDYAQAMRWYRMAADHGYSSAVRNVGILYKNGWGVPQDYAEAMRWFRKAADQGNAEAMNSIGVLFEYGLGVPQDYAQAMSWYRKAADQGNLTAETNIGLLYERGRGVPRDYAEAMRWYRKAADQGNAAAENNIGVLYDRGWGVPQDYVEGLRWYRMAADQGNDVAENNIAKSYETGRGVQKDLDQARLWRERAAASGNQDAKNWLASHRR